MPHKDLEVRRAYFRDYIAKNHDKVKAQRREYYLKNKARVHEMNRLNKRKYKLEAKMMLGGKCVCCGEREPELLTIDHVNNDGNKHNRGNYKYRRYENSDVYYEIRKTIRNGLPVTKYQVMCFNCNISKHFGKGVCIHKRKVRNVVVFYAGGSL